MCFVCKVLICANSARRHVLRDFDSTLSYTYFYFNSVIAAHVAVSCLVIDLCLFTSTLTFQFCFAAVPVILKVLQHFFHHNDTTSLLQCNLTKNPCKLGIL